MSKIYVAGPMSGLPEFNYPAFFEAARSLEKLGYEVLNPASLPNHPATLQPSEIWGWYMRRALLMLPGADEIAMLPDWHTSKGASLEKRIAEALGMKIWAFHYGELRELYV